MLHLKAFLYQIAVSAIIIASAVLFFALMCVLAYLGQELPILTGITILTFMLMFIACIIEACKDLQD